MPFVHNLVKYFDVGVRARGEGYLHSGGVQVVAGDRWLVDAKVFGTSTYRVSLFREGPTVFVSCTCPYFSDNGEPCKHIWATLRKADSSGYLLGGGDSGPTQLALDEYEDPDEQDAAFEKEDDLKTDGWIKPFPTRTQGQHSKPEPRKQPREPAWQRTLGQLRAEMQTPATTPNNWPSERKLVYFVDLEASRTGQGLALQVAYRERKASGDWAKPRFQRLYLRQIEQLPDPADRQILSFLIGPRAEDGYSYGSSYHYYYDTLATRYRLQPAQQQVLLPLLCQTGRCYVRRTPDEPEPSALHWDDGPPWEFWLALTADERGKTYELAGSLRRDGQEMPLSQPSLLLAGGLVFWDDQVARLQDFDAFAWISWLRSHGTLRVSAQQKDALLQELLQLPRLPRLALPPELSFEEVSLKPRPRLKVKAPNQKSYGQPRLRGELSFEYDGAVVAADQPGRGVYQAEQHRLVLRDSATEADAADRLQQLGFRARAVYGEPKPELQLAPRNLPRVVQTLLDAGWHVEAEGKVYRQPGQFQLSVSSGIDWFELHGSVDFDGQTADLPALLAALKRGDKTVRLDDGTVGILPEDWLKKYGLIAGLGKVEGDHLRFTRTQTGLLDALLAAQPEATWDAAFTRARDELRHFEGIEPTDPPSGFVGQLRGYQREGLGWLYFLQKFGFGGCLADDMGLGKTVQVLALLESRRELRAAATDGERLPPSLVVVPKSLIFNWKEEAARFTPDLKVLDHTGLGRTKPGAHFQDYDLVLTTYGTLRRDAAELKDIHFDYCILDEAQAIKNANTASAKATRLLQANHRLILSGTPVENHLGELWSLFEFLNPGMLGAASVFQLTGAGARNPSEETRTLLAKALRPFILRRTKEQVAKDLPEKLEQTIYCELDAEQRKRYDELRDHYRRSLLGRVDSLGLSKSKMQVLEALLRLRQAACHPGLIDKKRVDQPSAKLDALLPQLAEVLDGGHKVLVFSQFTSFLAIVRDRLDKEGITYEYLDGRTRDRAGRVERFQNDPDCKLFLISLKAGGLGLNLTAAEYVFLLDPWWNPAVEAQAIDRAHRIGQTKPVFAYRLIAKDTVEEKVLELQKTKRDLADAIINADNSLIRNLGREELELLLS